MPSQPTNLLWISNTRNKHPTKLYQGRIYFLFLNVFFVYNFGAPQIIQGSKTNILILDILDVVKYNMSLCGNILSKTKIFVHFLGGGGL